MRTGRASASPRSGASFDRRGITYRKKDGTCRRAAACGCEGSPRHLVRRPVRPRSRNACLHRRDGREDQDCAPAWARGEGRALSSRGAARPLEDDDVYGWPHLARPRRTDAHRRCYGRNGLRACVIILVPLAEARRHRRQGQSATP